MSNQDRYAREAAERARQGQNAGSYSNQSHIEQATRLYQWAQEQARQQQRLTVPTGKKT